MAASFSTGLLLVSLHLLVSLLLSFGYSSTCLLLDQGGNAGLTESGIAIGGVGAGGGGSAVSGSTGTAYGGNVQNQGGVVVNGFKSSTFLLFFPSF